MKKLALALVAATALAGAASAHLSTGFYMGAHTGWDSMRADYSQVNGGVAVAGSTQVGRDNPNIGLFAGYGWINGCFYWGGELGYTFANVKARDTLGFVAPAATELKRNGYFNAAVRLGYLFSVNTMGYIRLGVNWGKWSVNDTILVNAANPYTGSKSRASFAPGVGLETAVHKNVYVRAEWTYEFASSVRATRAAVANTSSTYNSIRSNSFKLGIAYKF